MITIWLIGAVLAWTLTGQNLECEEPTPLLVRIALSAIPPFTAAVFIVSVLEEFDIQWAFWSAD